MRKTQRKRTGGGPVIDTKTLRAARERDGMRKDLARKLARYSELASRPVRDEARRARFLKRMDNEIDELKARLEAAEARCAQARAGA